MIHIVALNAWNNTRTTINADGSIEGEFITTDSQPTFRQWIVELVYGILYWLKDNWPRTTVFVWNCGKFILSIIARYWTWYVYYGLTLAVIYGILGGSILLGITVFFKFCFWFTFYLTIFELALHIIIYIICWCYTKYHRWQYFRAERRQAQAA